MRQTQIFSGSSHPALVDAICDRLGQSPGRAELRKFSNGETSVQIQTSVRDKDVFIVQSGSSRINDNVMELLIMISACRGGSSRSITAVMPYFPYSRQSKKKSHRGAITARMIANLLHIAGVNHVITIDLHANQMQGFFKCPVDNLVAEPIIARWIKQNIPNWNEAVVVSKNPGGTKRVTSLADAMKLSFGIVTTDRRRPYKSGIWSANESMALNSPSINGMSENGDVIEHRLDSDGPVAPESRTIRRPDMERPPTAIRSRASSNPLGQRSPNGTPDVTSNPSAKANGVPIEAPADPIAGLRRSRTQPAESIPADGEEYTDERAKDVIRGRLIHGHIVDDDFPSPAISAVSTTHSQRGKHSSDDEGQVDLMTTSMISTASSFRQDENVLGGNVDAGASSEEEEEDLQNPDLETTVTLVGNVKNRPVFIVDDMIDKPSSWIAAAETVVKRGGATKVYCLATHGLFGDNCLKEMEACPQIDRIVVTNSFPIPEEKSRGCKKLTVLGVHNLIAEAIRRNHHGESISQLYMHYD